MRSNQATSYKLFERPIYGNSRVGIDNTELELFGYTAPTSGILANVLGNKQYEFSNHLGNVLTTVTDKKIPVDDGNDGTIDYYVADITSATDYYPFGSPMDGRTYSSDKYRFGFNGKEKDDELKGEGNSYDFDARIYDSRLGKWLSCDPKTMVQPSWSSYKAFLDNPILYVDPDGETEYVTIITMNEQTGNTYITTFTTNKVMTDGVQYRRGGNAAFYFINKYFDYSTVIVNTIGTDGQIKSKTITKTIFTNKFKGFSYVWNKGASKGDTKTESKPFTSRIGGMVIYGSAGSSDESPATPTTGKMWGSFDFAEFQELIGLITTSVATRPENTLGPDKSLKKLREIGDKAEEAIEESKKEKAEEKRTEPFTIQQYAPDGTSMVFDVSGGKSATDSAKIVQAALKNAKGANVKVNGKIVNKKQ